LLLGCPATPPPSADETSTDDEVGTTTTGDGDGDTTSTDDATTGMGEPIALQGTVQKGPLIVGSSIDVSPIDQFGVPTGDNFPTQTINDLGEFSLAAVPTGDIFIEGDGYFYNEVLGTISTAPLTLRAYHRLDPNNDVVRLNLLTQLTSGRIVQLLNEGLGFSAAVLQSETELRSAMGIGVSDGALGPMIELDLLGDPDFGNAYLLAVSAVFIQVAVTQAGPMGAVDGQLQQLINSITLDFASDGELPMQTRTQLRQAEFDLDPAVVEANLATRAQELGLMGPLPDIDVALDQDRDTLANIDDNCPKAANLDQADTDRDTVGDACDNCPDTANPDQADINDDGEGDVCDTTCFSDADCDQFDGQCTEASCNADHVCEVLSINDGESCTDDDLCYFSKECHQGMCTFGQLSAECQALFSPCNPVSCDPRDGTCYNTVDPDGSDCNDQLDCTVEDGECMSGECVAPDYPGHALFEDFSGDAPGWTLGPEWEIGPAVASNCGPIGENCPAKNDPSSDHTATDDNRLAGVVIGGCTSTGVHADYCLTSPVVDTSNFQEAHVTYWQRMWQGNFNMVTTVQVWDGNAWVEIENNFGCLNGDAWSARSENVTQYKNPDFQVRFCYRNENLTQAVGGWSLDDVMIGPGECYPPELEP
jgi:hypothetical protein